MPSRNGAAPRCAVLVGPYSSGKTSLLEALLHSTGAIERKGLVKDGNTVGDSADEAKKRQASTELSIAHTSFLGDNWTFIDTPGNVEFGQEARNACMVADIAVVVCDPEVSKVTALTPVLKFLDANGIPHLIFVNKIDTASDTVRQLLAALQEVSERPLVLRQVPIRDGEAITGYVDLVSERAYRYQPGQPSALIKLPDEMEEREKEARNEMLETLADFDDALLEQLLEEIEPDKSSVYEQISLALQQDLVVPVLLGAAEKDHGVLRLLKALRHDAPGVAQTAARRGLKGDGEPVAQVFKTLHAQHVGKLSLARVFRGTIKDGDTLNDMRVSGINSQMGAKMEKRPDASAGDVVALGRMEELKTGDVLTPSGKAPTGALAWPAVPSPVYTLALSATNRNDEVKLSGILHKLVEEDPSISMEHNADVGELRVSGQGDTQLKVLIERLDNRFKLNVESRQPNVAYKETIKRTTDQHARHKKQSGGHGQFADIKVKIGPLPRGEGFRFADSVVGGSVPRNYIPAVEEGVMDYMKRGPLGFPVIDFRVELYDGQFHAVDSSDMAFKTAARIAMSEGLPKCEPVLLEPVLHVTISVPNDATSRIQRLVTGRRGQILGFSAKTDWKNWDEVVAYIPESEMHDLIMEVRSYTLGVGTFEWRFDHLAELVGRIAGQVVGARTEAAAG